MLILLVLLGLGVYGLTRAGKFVKENPAKSLQAAALIRQAFRK